MSAAASVAVEAEEAARDGDHGRKGFMGTLEDGWKLFEVGETGDHQWFKGLGVTVMYVMCVTTS